MNRVSNILSKYLGGLGYLDLREMLRSRNPELLTDMEHFAIEEITRISESTPVPPTEDQKDKIHRIRAYLATENLLPENGLGTLPENLLLGYTPNDPQFPSLIMETESAQRVFCSLFLTNPQTFHNFLNYIPEPYQHIRTVNNLINLAEYNFGQEQLPNPQNVSYLYLKEAEHQKLNHLLAIYSRRGYHHAPLQSEDVSSWLKFEEIELKNLINNMSSKEYIFRDGRLFRRAYQEVELRQPSEVLQRINSLYNQEPFHQAIVDFIRFGNFLWNLQIYTKHQTGHTEILILTRWLPFTGWIHAPSEQHLRVFPQSVREHWEYLQKVENRAAFQFTCASAEITPTLAYSNTYTWHKDDRTIPTTTPASVLVCPYLNTLNQEDSNNKSIFGLHMFLDHGTDPNTGQINYHYNETRLIIITPNSDSTVKIQGGGLVPNTYPSSKICLGYKNNISTKESWMNLVEDFLRKMFSGWSNQDLNPRNMNQHTLFGPDLVAVYANFLINPISGEELTYDKLPETDSFQAQLHKTCYDQSSMDSPLSP